MQKLILITLLFSLVLTLTPSVSAQSSASDSGTDRMEAKELRTAVKNERKDVAKDKQTAKRASDSAKGEKRGFVMNADLTGISGTTLTITKDGKAYTVTTSETTKLKRHYGGDSALTEFAVGNKIDVLGLWTDTAGTTIAAGTIRNRSIMKRWGAFIGEVVSKTGNTIVLKPKNRENQTVTLSTTTKYINREAKTITSVDVLVGHRIRVKGVWDKSNNTIIQVTQLKDFSLPVRAMESAESATPSATPVL
jgi:hypothetical protein